MTDGGNIISLGGGIDFFPSKLLSSANFWRRGGNSYCRRHFRISIADVRIPTFPEAVGSSLDRDGLRMCRRRQPASQARQTGLQRP